MKPPFAAIVHALRGGGLLRPMTAAEAGILGREAAAIDPYRTLGMGAGPLVSFLERRDSWALRFAIESNGALAGVLAIRWPWLRGPFIDMLTLLPAHQGHGLGRAAVAWTACQATTLSPNLWATVSDFNAPARAFWMAQGFVEVVDLPDLIVDGRAEILLRRRLGPP